MKDMMNPTMTKSLDIGVPLNKFSRQKKQAKRGL
jgi:hypothetical protein